MVTRAAVFMRQRMKDSKSFKCSASRRSSGGQSECTQSVLDVSGVRIPMPRVHGEILTQT